MDRIGDYIAMEVLGEGASGIVRVGVHSVTKAKVALKIISHRKFEVGKNEISILASARHPSLVGLIDVFPWENKIVLVLEFAPYGDAFDYICEKGKLSEDRARRWFRILVEGLEYLHTNLIVHRDLKLENILVVNENKIKITDFGLSRFMKPGNRLSTWCGSPIYAAPELMTRNNYMGPKVDVWSLGVVLFAMLTGSMPWASDDGVIIHFQSFVRGEFNFPRGCELGEECRDLIRSMLRADPDQRISIDAIKSHPWVVQAGPMLTLRYSNDAVELIDEEIVKQMEFMGYDRTHIDKALESDEPSTQRTLYNTLVRAKERLEKNSKKEMTVKRISHKVRKLNRSMTDRRKSEPIRVELSNEKSELRNALNVQLQELGVERYLKFLEDLDEMKTRFEKNQIEQGLQKQENIWVLYLNANSSMKLNAPFKYLPSAPIDVPTSLSSSSSSVNLAPYNKLKFWAEEQIRMIDPDFKAVVDGQVIKHKPNVIKQLRRRLTGKKYEQ